MVFSYSLFPGLKEDDGSWKAGSNGEEWHGGDLRSTQGPDHAEYLRLWQRTWLLVFLL